MKRFFQQLILFASFFILLTPLIGVPPSSAQALNGGGSNYTAQNNNIYQNGSQLTLHGVNWFGAETPSHVVQGLSQRNYWDILSQIKQLGFNAVRLPFCPQTIHGDTVSDIDYSKNPDLQGLNSQQVFDKIVQAANDEHLYIVLDHHNVDCSHFTQYWYGYGYTEEQWIQDLHFVTDRYRNLPYFVGINLKNEPYGATWGTGDTATDWKIASEKAGQAVLQTNNNLLVFVEGVQNNPQCSSTDQHWWGGNFEPVNCYPINSSMIPQNKVVYSPAVYGPDLYAQDYFSAPNFPNNLPGIWQRDFGFLVDRGQTVAISEWGGKFGTDGGDPRDPVVQNELSSYLVTKHICNTFYWALNPNTGDKTEGLLESDWQTPWPQKLQFLTNFFASCH